MIAAAGRTHAEHDLFFVAQPPASVTTLVDSWIQQDLYSGASLRVVRRGKVVCEAYWGDHQAGTKEFVASAGKWLAAATILAVVEEGKLSLDDSAEKWLPQLAGGLGQATLRQMLGHTSGFPPYQPSGAEPDACQTLEESVQRLQNLEYEHAPGMVWNYGGLAMQVAGRMAEVATGESWEAIFQSRIGLPLQMTNTHFTPVDSKAGHNPMLGGGAQSTLRDYSNFLDMLANDGRFKGKPILQPSSIEEMFKDAVGNAIVPHDNFVYLTRGSTHRGIYGLGVWREEEDERGEAVLLSSPSWAGTYPWVDKRHELHGMFLAHVNECTKISTFNPMVESAVLPHLIAEYFRESI